MMEMKGKEKRGKEKKGKERKRYVIFLFVFSKMKGIEKKRKERERKQRTFFPQLSVQMWEESFGRKLILIFLPFPFLSFVKIFREHDSFFYFPSPSFPFLSFPS